MDGKDSFVKSHGTNYLQLMKLYRFKHSPFARKVQAVLDIAGIAYQSVDVVYRERDELATLTGGYVYVPVLVDDAGTVVTDSRDICEHLMRRADCAWLVPEAWHGPVWAYHDFADLALEDITFKIASPSTRDSWQNPTDRALYIMSKERKFGAGCIEAWRAGQDALIARARRLLTPTLHTLAARPFLFGEAPTLADLALFGQYAMLDEAAPTLLPRIDAGLCAHRDRIRTYRRSR